jgi:hypothetical protein
MADYGLFLMYKFSSADGLFLTNQKPREPDCRFWDQVLPDPAHPGSFMTLTNRMVQDPTNPKGPLIPVNSRINADTKTMEFVARTHPPTTGDPTDRVFFAVCNSGGAAPVLNSITFSCGLNPGIGLNKSTVAAPFRDGAEIQCLLTGRAPFTTITSADPSNPAKVDTYDAIGPYNLIKDPDKTVPQGSSCFFKLTLIASATRGGKTREFSYDPDMDIEMGL